jgi:hypothetical protein
VANHPEPTQSVDGKSMQHAITRPLTLAIELNNQELLEAARRAINERLDLLVQREEFRWIIELAQTFLLRARKLNVGDLIHAADCVALAATHFEREENELLEHQMRELEISLRSKLKSSTESLDSLRVKDAISYQNEGRRREADSPMAASLAYSRALSIYQNLPSGAFKREIVDLERNLKRQNELGRAESVRIEVPFEFDLTDTEEFAEALLDLKRDDMLHTFISSSKIIPSLSQIRLDIANSRHDTPLLYLFPRATMRDGNAVRRSSSEEEIADDLVADEYAIWMQVNLARLELIIERLDRGGHWKSRYLVRRFRQAVFFRDRDLRLLEHALRRYFAHDYITSVQLLSLQLEPALRSILPLIGLPTSVTDRRSGTTQEKNIGELTATDELTALLGEDYIYFVRFALSDQRGLLLRHSTAHGLLSADHCHKMNADLLVYSLLWLTLFVPVRGT